MAFELTDSNLSGVAIIDAPAGVVATSDNFIDLYTYAQQYKPELVPQLHMANGLGKITAFLRITGKEGSYASDQIQHAEQGRLHNILKDVAVTGNVFTSPTNHNLRLGDEIMVSDGLVEVQAEVTVLTSDTVFTATNNAGGGYSFTGNVDVIADFTNSFGKGTKNFDKGKRWSPSIYKNHTHILKETFEVNGSDMIHNNWVMTPQGPRWFSFEAQRTADLFDNKQELTNIFYQRKATGDARGLNGVVPQIESRGNVGNEYITDIEDLSEIARRAKQQGTCREFTVWADHNQMAYFRKMMSGVNSGFLNGSHYGTFSNSADMALKLDFKSVLIDGVVFHFTPWALLEDPTLMGNAKFLATNLACLIVPSGKTYIQEEGNTVSKSYLSCRFRQDGQISRKRQVQIFGPNGTRQSKDAQTTEYLSEFTNQVIGANNYFVVRRNVAY